MTKQKSIFLQISERTDWLLCISLFFILAIGCVSIYSASMNYINPLKFITTQVIAVFAGIAAALIFSSFNYQYYKHFSGYIYLFSCILLISVLVLGSTIKGTKGWFNFGFFSVQPVEFAKIMFILVLAAFLDRYWREIRNFSTFFKALCILGGHIVLIMMQPDFSSTLPYYPITLILLYVAGVKLRYILSVILYGGLSMGIPLFITFIKLQPADVQQTAFFAFVLKAYSHLPTALLVLFSVAAVVFIIKWLLYKLRIPMPVLYPVIFIIIVFAGSFSSIVVEKSLKEYQRKRLIVFLEPSLDARGAGYNVIQSKIAIGSGQIAGKGFFRGTQTQLGFLPEQRTDFIFAVIGEEGGYLFAQLTMLFYLFFIWRALVIAKNARDRYGSYVATGISTLFAFNAVINIGMVTGLMPATGLPLLLVSYGGSSVTSSMVAIGILMSIYARRFIRE